MRRLALFVALCLVATTGWSQDLKAALERARVFAEEHRYEEVVDLMSAFGDIEEPEARYAVAAELGRAHFHLGHYAEADAAFREAVRLRPERVETALYFEASSYLLGNREQAYAIFREIVASGATDLYLAVSLPGERHFLADPQIWAILSEHETPVTVDLDRGTVLGVAIGDRRIEVERRLGVTPATSGSALTARAGPYLTWVFTYAEDGLLAQITLYNEHLYRYTPYRLRLTDELDWRSTPSDATRALGAPMSTASDDENLVVMRWQRASIQLTMEFAIPQEPAPPGVDPTAPLLRVARISRLDESPAGSSPEEDSHPKRSGN